MKVLVAPEAAAQILIRKQWWRTHPESFPAHSERAGRTVRRCLLSRTSCHLYFEVVASAGEIWILAAWGAAQRRGPRLPRR